jgi:Subtilase family/Peptidase inhibitor I9
MSHRWVLGFVRLAMACGVVIAGVAWSAPGFAQAAGANHRVVVELAPSADQGTVVADTRAHGSRIKSRYRRVFNGFAATVTDGELARLRHDRRVRAIDRDVTFHAADTEAPAPSWGLDRIDQRLLPLDTSFTSPSAGAGVTAYVVDTGVSAIADLGSRLLPGVDEVTVSACDPAGDTTDHTGHGTFVADEIGGTTYGLAKSISIVPVKVLDCHGGGELSTILAGLDWIAQNASGLSVANMSLTANDVLPTLSDAVATLVAKGITVVVAAGNGGGDVGFNFHTLNACNVSPAGAPDAIAVGATDSSDTYASFSNFGPCVALSAPGVDIAAYDNNGSPKTDSGTSMASPEVAAVAALTLAANPGLTPAGVRACLVGGATPWQIHKLPANTANLLLFLPQALACRTVTGVVKQALTAGPGVTLINNATISGAITIGAGRSVAISGSRLTGSVTATGADLVTVCGSSLTGQVKITADSGPVTLGGPSGSSCAPDTISKSASVSSNVGGVRIDGGTITASLAVIGNSGGISIEGNTLSAPFSLTGTTPEPDGRPTVVAANRSTASFACAQNNPVPVDNGYANIDKAGGTGQCQAMTERRGTGILGHVYWTESIDDGTINGLSLAGGALPTTLAALQGQPFGLAVDSDYLYWANSLDRAINKAPRAGGPVTTLAPAPCGPVGVAVDSSQIYWACVGAIVEAPLAGGPTTFFPAGLGTQGVAVDATHIYWANAAAGTINEAPLAGGDPTILASGQSFPIGVAVDSRRVYWANSTIGTINSVPLTGGAPTTLVSGQNRPIGVAVDSTRIYWANYEDGTINAAPLTGGTPTTLVSGQSHPFGVAIGP